MLFVLSQLAAATCADADSIGLSFEQIDREALEHRKLATVFDRPHLKRSAWVITPGFPKAFYENLRAFSVRELPTFQTREQALSYLVGEDEEEKQELAPPA